MSPVSTAPTPALKRQYPHVDDITDWRAQQSVRLLWDRIFDLEARLQGSEATVRDLVSQHNAQETQLATVERKAQQALAEAQLTAAERHAADLAEGESTIPDYLAIVEATLATFDPVIPAADADAGKAQLTRAAAWAIFATDPNIGLLAKTSGTNVNGRSVDICVQMTDGSFADCAAEHDNGDGTVTIQATWQQRAPDDNTTDETRWIVPTALIAAEAGPMGPA